MGHRDRGQRTWGLGAMGGGATDMGAGPWAMGVGATGLGSVGEGAVGHAHTGRGLSLGSSCPRAGVHTRGLQCAGLQGVEAAGRVDARAGGGWLEDDH